MIVTPRILPLYPLFIPTTGSVSLCTQKMAATSPSVPQLFTELDKFAKDGNYAKAQKIANKSKIKYSSMLVDLFLLSINCILSFSSPRET